MIRRASRCRILGLQMSAIEAMVLPFLIVFASWILSDHSVKADDNHKDIGSQDLSNIVILIDNHSTLKRLYMIYPKLNLDILL